MPLASWTVRIRLGTATALLQAPASAKAAERLHLLPVGCVKWAQGLHLQRGPQRMPLLCMMWGQPQNQA